MTTSMGISPSGMQASAAVVNVEAVAREPHTRRDDVVAPVDTSGGGSAKADFSPSKPSQSMLGRHVDLKV